MRKRSCPGGVTDAGSVPALLPPVKKPVAETARGTKKRLASVDLVVAHTREAYGSGGRVASSSDGSCSLNPKISIANKTAAPNREATLESDAFNGQQELRILAFGTGRNEQLAPLEVGVMKRFRILPCSGSRARGRWTRCGPADHQGPGPTLAQGCFASFWTWLDSTAADCPLSYAGFTVYATLDAGLGYYSQGAPWNPAVFNGTQGLISKQSNGSKSLCQSNGRSSSRGATPPPSSDTQAARARHSANVAERLCL